MRVVRGFEIEHDASARAYVVWTHHEAGQPEILLQVHYGEDACERLKARLRVTQLTKMWADVFRVDAWETSQTRH